MTNKLKLHHLYHLPRKSFRIRSLRGVCIQVIKQRKEQTIVKLLGNGIKRFWKGGWKRGDRIKVNREEIVSYGKYKSFVKREDK